MVLRLKTVGLASLVGQELERVNQFVMKHNYSVPILVGLSDRILPGRSQPRRHAWDNVSAQYKISLCDRDDRFIGR